MVMQQAPPSFPGTLPEFLVYQELTKRKIEFEYQSSQMGGRQARGGAVLDFYIPSLNLGINVQSTYYHYQNWTAKVNDALQREQLEAMGITMVYIDEEALLRNASYYVGAALEGRDYSLMTR